jgi:ornithine decarboxylase
MEDYFKIIQRGLARLHLPRTCRVFCTPGRALVADSVAVLVRVEQRRGQMLYINEGVMGSLANINLPWNQPPVRLIRPNGKPRSKLDKYLFSGPSCYGDDTMPGPFYLPEDARAGDYIELGQCGAYAGAMTSAFHSQPWPEIVTVGNNPPIPKKEEELPDDYHSGVYDYDDDEEYSEDGEPGDDADGDEDAGGTFEDVTKPRRR